ncbi:MAG TPA: hypothetical protein VGN97_08385 [Mesorhizobium sp.]|nr:hypothetical protein [Mesorhizobium sp.]
MIAGASRLSALTLLLPDFGQAAASRPAKPAEAEVAPPSRPAAVDVEAAIAGAVAAAEQALRERLDAQRLVEFDALRAAHAAEIEGLQAQAGVAAAARIAASFEALEARLSAELSRAAGALLLPVVGEEAARRAGEALGAAVRSALEERRQGGEMPPMVAAKGPRALWETLSARLEAAGIRATWEEAPGFDIAVSAGGEVWETRIGEVMAAARAALGTSERA